MATGFHGFHVIIGTTFLAVCLWRAWRGHFKPDHHFGFEAAAWYWHFVDVVWLFLFVCVYWWGMGGGWRRALQADRDGRRHRVHASRPVSRRSRCCGRRSAAVARAAARAGCLPAC